MEYLRAEAQQQDQQDTKGRSAWLFLILLGLHVWCSKKKISLNINSVALGAINKVNINQTRQAELRTEVCPFRGDKAWLAEREINEHSLCI